MSIFESVRAERRRQERLKAAGRFAHTCADAELSDAECMTVLAEEVGEVAHEINETIGRTPDAEYIARLRAELVQVAAVAVAWVERLDAQVQP